MSTTNNERADFPSLYERTGDITDINTLLVPRASLAAKAPAAPIGWYALAADGMATLCVDRDDAEKTAADSEKEWPNCGPFRAVQLYTAPPAPTEQWVSVETRLPEKNTEVLIAFAENTLPSTGQFTGSAKDHDGWCYPQENSIWPGERQELPDGGWPTVTHWMPLPAPPQGAAKVANDAASS